MQAMRARAMAARNIYGQQQQTIDHAKPQTRYAVGSMSQITVDDLLSNPVAIKQLMLDVRTLGERLDIVQGELEKKVGEVDHLRIAPFVAIANLIVSATGAAIGAIGTNWLTNDHAKPYSLMVTIGGYGLIVVMGLVNILFPYARRWFAPSNTQGQPP